MKLREFFKLIFLVYSVIGNLQNSNAESNADGEYAFYFPRNMMSGQPSTVCLTLSNSYIPAILDINYENYPSPTSYNISEVYSCVKINVPTFSAYVAYINIQMKIKANNKIIEGEGAIAVDPQENVLFIETDRAFYKMGEVVKIRLLVLTYDFKPAMNYQIPSVKILNPSRTTVAVWENVVTDNGLVQLELQLAPETLTGIWNIKSGKVERTFTVEQYVLPRYKVNIVSPENLYYQANIMNFSICAKYSYGQNVKGAALLKINKNYHYRWRRDISSISKIKELTNGCAKFNFTQAELPLENSWSLKLEASVTEKDTEQVESHSREINIERLPFSLIISDHLYKPGLPYIGYLKLNNVKIPIEADIIEVCFKAENIAESVCANFTAYPENITEFVVPPFKDDVENIHLTGRSITYYPDVHMEYKTLPKWHSNSKNVIQIKKLEDMKKIKCGSAVDLDIFYTSKDILEGDVITFFYMVLSRKEIVKMGQVQDKVKKNYFHTNDSLKFKGNIGKYFNFENAIDKFQLHINLNEEVHIDLKIIVYHVFNNEMIADQVEVVIQKCLPNKVEAFWTDSTLYPGEISTLNIKTNKNSLCAVSSIDKSSKFMGSGTSINTDSIFKSYDSFKNAYSGSHLNCIKLDVAEKSVFENDYYSRHWRFGWRNPDTTDSSDIFRNVKVGVISNINILTKICEKYPRYNYRRYGGVLDEGLPIAERGFIGFSGRRQMIYVTEADDVTFDSDMTDRIAKPIIEDRGSEIRSYFPETWLWDLIPVTKSDSVEVERKLPDSITNWETNVLCVSPKNGVGMSDTFELNVFKPFFIDVLMPYSIKRNTEILHLPVVVFNYLDSNLEVRTTLLESDGLNLVDGEKANNMVLHVGAQDSTTHYYRIKANKLGRINVTILAFPIHSSQGGVPLNQDIVQRELLVEPEGYRSEIVKSALLCGNGSKEIVTIQWELILPDNVILDTVSGKVILNSDILGPTFQNLENILMVPTGCGEQTMATLTPNLYVFKYLQANNALEDETKERILKNMKIGYQRILTYVHYDGSFSAFGKSDSDGSMFLTAFVIRTLRQMKEYMTIDDHVIRRALSWIEEHQLENGCFDPVRHVFHDMGIASSQNQTTALTAYVLISVLETNVEVSQSVLQKAKACLSQDESSDKYTMAISSYAFSLMSEKETANNKLKKLLEVANRENDLIWFKQSETSHSANVEVSSYAVMALLNQSTAENTGTANSIIRWLQTKMTPRGGFFSTVDTVVGLDAISRYAILTSTEEPSLNVEIHTKNYRKNVLIEKRDSSKINEVPLDSFPNTVKIKALGYGCISVQAAVSFYQEQILTNDVFKLDVSVKSLKQDTCSLMELKPCISYTGPGQSNMAIVEVTMPSGYEPDQTSLHELKSKRNSAVKKFEQIKNEVVFYFTQLNENEICIPFKIKENLVVENVADAIVKLYDYYKPEISISKSFSINICNSNKIAQTL